MDKISAQDYINNPELLEVYYLSADNKMACAKTIVGSAIEEYNGAKIINLATIKLVTQPCIVGLLTNIDTISRNDNGLNGYEELEMSGHLQEIIDVLGSQFTLMNDLVDSEVETFNMLHNNISITMSQLVSALSSLMQNVNIDDLQKLLSESIEK